MTDYNLITVTEFQANVPELDLSQYDAPTISGMISRASKMVSDYLLFTPLQETIVDEVKTAMIDSMGDLVIFPNKIPVVSVSGISIMKGATTVEINLLDGNNTPKYNVDYSGRHIRYPNGELTLQGVPIFTDFMALRGTQFYTKITYTAGWTPSSLPQTIKEACYLFMRDIVSKKFNITGATELSQGGVSYRFSNSSGKSKFQTEAEKLLNPYRRVG